MYVRKVLNNLRDVKRQYSTRSDRYRKTVNITPGIQPPGDEAQAAFIVNFAHTDKFAVLTFRERTSPSSGAPDVRTGLPFLK